VIVESSISWKDPSTWPWFLYAWAAFFLAGATKPIWRWFQQARVTSWPVVDGRIDSTNITSPSFSVFGKQGHYLTELLYSYSAEGSFYSGRYSREIPTEVEAAEFIRDLQDKSLIIHYDPGKPSRSIVLEPDIESLIQRRAPAQLELPSQSVDNLPLWVTPLLPVLLTLSGIGLILSLGIHLDALRGRRLAPESFFWGLHLGIFLVWFPAILIAQKLVGYTRGRDFWKVLLKDCPSWLRYVIYGFMGYAVVNFLLCFGTEKAVGTGSNPSANVWRGFSGHWMAFYVVAAAVFYSAISASRTRANKPQNL
jgi:hypothetical protein